MAKSYSRQRSANITRLQYSVQVRHTVKDLLHKRRCFSNRLLRTDSRRGSRILVLGVDDDRCRIEESVAGSLSKLGCNPPDSSKSSANNCSGLVAQRHAYVARPNP